MHPIALQVCFIAFVDTNKNIKKKGRVRVTRLAAGGDCMNNGDVVKELWDVKVSMSELQDSLIQMESTLQLLCGILTKGADALDDGIHTIERVSQQTASKGK